MNKLMVGKLSKDWKADWLRHLPELVNTYTSMRLAITGYSPHYLMFGLWPHLPIDFYFPTVRGMKKHQYVNYCIAELCEWLQEAFKEAQMQSTSQAERQKRCSDRKLMPFDWNQVIWSWLKLTPTGGGERWRISGRKEPYKVECQIMEGIPS